MNWTGGRLQRHSRNAKGGVTAKQKEHFAKVRNAQQDVTSKMSPIKLSVVNQIANQPQTNVLRRSQEEDDFRHAPDQSVRHSVSQTGRDGKRARVPPRETSQEHIYSSRTNTPQLEAIRRIKQEQHETTERRDSSHFQRISKHRRDTESPPAEQEDDGDENISKRRKILLQRDWVGVSLPKPPELNYKPSETIHQIGRRRKVSAGHRARFEHRRRETPLAPKTQTKHKGSGTPITRNADVRISIGGKELRIGVSSSSGIGKTHLDHVRNSTEKASSDIMLLDYEEADGQGASNKNVSDSRVGLTSVGQRRGKSPTAADALLLQRFNSSLNIAKYPNTPRAERNLPFIDPQLYRDIYPRAASKNSSNNQSLKSRNPASSRSRRTLNTSEIRELYHRFRDQPDNNETFEVPSETHHDYTGQNIHNGSIHYSRTILSDMIGASERNSRAVSSDRFTLLSFDEGRDDTGDSVHGNMERQTAPRLPVLDSRANITRSSPLILHPAPQSSRTSQLLRSDVSDAGLSMAVQTGKVEQAPREVDDLDEEVWKSWVLPEDEPADQSSDDEASESEQISLTPGISTYDARLRHLSQQRSSPAEEVQNHVTEGTNVSEAGENDTQDDTDIDESALQLHSESGSYLHQEEAHYEEEREEDFTGVAPALAPDKVKSSAVDENALWQQFVFTSDSDDGSEVRTKSQANSRQLFSARDQHSEDSSLLANRSTETDEPSQQRPLIPTIKSHRFERESSASDSVMNGRESVGATQGTRMDRESSSSESIINDRVTQGTGANVTSSSSIPGTDQRVPDDVQSTLATQGSQSSSPDILSQGSPLLRSISERDSTGSHSVMDNVAGIGRRIIVFTKPEPFVGKKGAVDGKRSPLRIGGRLSKNNGTKRSNEEGSRRERGGNEIYESRSDDDVESIEDY